MMDFDGRGASNVQFHGGRESYRTLVDIQTADERAFKAKLSVNAPLNPYVSNPSKLGRCCTNCCNKFVPDMIREITAEQVKSVLGPCIVISTCLFLVFILPWLPMAFENHRSCAILAPDEGIIPSDTVSSVNESELELSQFIMGFDRDGLLRERTKYDAYLYSRDMATHIARYTGDTDEVVFEELDPLCLPTAPTTGPVHFCLTPRNNIIPGAPKNRGGVPPVIDITSPQLPDFLLTMTVRLRKLKIVFPNIEFVYENVTDFQNIENGSKIMYTSSKNSALYLRRTFFEYGSFSDSTSTVAPLIWPGLATPILATGDYRGRFGLDRVPRDVKNEGKYHRLCVPTRQREVELLPEDLPDDPIALFETVLLSPEVSAKVEFHMRASSLYKDFTGNNRALKVGLSAFLLFVVINGGLLMTEFSD